MRPRAQLDAWRKRLLLIGVGMHFVAKDLRQKSAMISENAYARFLGDR